MGEGNDFARGYAGRRGIADSPPRKLVDVFHHRRTERARSARTARRLRRSTHRTVAIASAEPGARRTLGRQTRRNAVRRKRWQNYSSGSGLLAHLWRGLMLSEIRGARTQSGRSPTPRDKTG